MWPPVIFGIIEIMYETRFLKSETAALSSETQDVVSQAVERVYQEVHRELNLPECEVLISVNQHKTRANEGVLGFPYDQNTVYLFVNADKLEEKIAIASDAAAHTITEHLYRSIYATARTHHRGLDADCGLLEEVINEGLSERFVVEKMILSTKQRLTQTTDQEIRRLWGKMKGECAESAQDIEKWFWGKEEESIPPSAASIVGFAITDAYLKETQQKSTDALTISAKRIVAQQQCY